MDQEPMDVEYDFVNAADEPKKEQTTAVTPYQGMGLLTPEMLAKAEACVEGVKKVKALALRVTSYTDWVQMGGKGYLCDSGAQKVSRLFGVDWEKPTIRETSEMIDGHEVRTYICDVVAVFQGRRYPQQGVVSSNGSFYSKKTHWIDKEGGGREKVEEEIPFAERDFVKLRKHALTNAMGRGLRGLLGLNGIPWTDVEGALGTGAGKAAAVSYNKGGTVKPKEATTAEGEDIRKKLWSMLMDLGDHDETLAGNLLEKETSFQGKDGNTVKGFRDPFNPKISDKWIQGAYGKIKKQWEPTFGGPPEDKA